MTGYDRVGSSRSVTSSMRGSGENAPVPPRASCTFWAECGRNGDSSVLQSLTACAAVCSTVPRRSGSFLSFHGSVSEMYRLASWTTRMASPIAARWRCVPMSSPTRPNAVVVVASRASSTVVRGPGSGIAPTFLWIMLAVRLTRLPQPATSSSLVRRLKSAQVKSASWLSGPAVEM